jgi:hypothetical protein
MYFPAEISNFKVKLRYIGRSTKRFTFSAVYEGTYAYGEERGYMASSLDYIILPDGYRILPWEQKRYFQWLDPMNIALKIMYGRSSIANSMRNLVYNENLFLKMIKKDPQVGTYFPVPILYKSSEPFAISRINGYSIITMGDDET